VDEHDPAGEPPRPAQRADGHRPAPGPLTDGGDAVGGDQDASHRGQDASRSKPDVSGGDWGVSGNGQGDVPAGMPEDDFAAGTGDSASGTDDSVADTGDPAVDAGDCAADEDGRGVPEDDDFDADAEMARWIADLESGRERIPEEWESEGPAVSISLGDAADVDPALLAAMAGPDGLGGESLSPLFGQHQSADALRPGPLLAALAEQAVSDIAALTDDQLFGALHAARRLENRAVYLQTVAVAEFGRRRAAQCEDARARKVPKGRRPGEFPAEELASELVSTAHYAGARIEGGLALTSRLPRTLAGMAAGLIDGWRAGIITDWTASLTDADAAYADEILAAVAPSLRPDQLARKAAALELKLNPEGVKARREHAKATRQRVEVRREDSGNACLAGRELDTIDALASKAYIDALAVRIRNVGSVEGSLSSIRARVMTELLQGRNPLHLMRPRPGVGLACDAPPSDAQPSATPQSDTPQSDAAAPAGDGDCADSDDADDSAGVRDPDDPGPDAPDDIDDFGCFDDGEDSNGYDDSEDLDGAGDSGTGDPGPGDPGPDDFGDRKDPDFGGPGPGYAGPDGAPAWSPDEAANARYADPDDDPGARRGPLRPGESALPPANLNLIIPIGTLLGWSTAPAQAGGFGLLDPDETRALAQAASRHPRTRWSLTIIDPSGQAIAHGRARGQHPWNPPPPQTPPATTAPPKTPPATTPPATAPPGPPPPAPPPGTPPPPSADGPTPEQHARLRDLIRALNVTLDPIAQGDCDHQHAENRYTPSRKLRDLIRARSTTCDAPGCNAQAIHCDQDHTVPYPDGPTCQCNLGPKCRRHHRAKQAPGWKAEQPQPGITRWTIPNGRTHTTTPTTYEF